MKKYFFSFLFCFLFLFWGIGFAEQVQIGNGIFDIPNDFKPLNLSESEKNRENINGAAYFNSSGDAIMIFALKNFGRDIDVDSQEVQSIIREECRTTDMRTFTYAGRKILTATATDTNGELYYLGCFVKSGVLYVVHYSEKSNITRKKIVSPFGRQLVFSIINSFKER